MKKRAVGVSASYLVAFVLASCSGTPEDPATVLPKDLSLVATDLENTQGVVSLAHGTNRVLFGLLGQRNALQARDDGTTSSVLCDFTTEAAYGVTEVNGRAYVLAGTGAGRYGVYVEPSIANQPCELVFEAEGEPRGYMVTIPNGFVIPHPSHLEFFDVRTNTRSTLVQFASGRTISGFYLYAAERALVYIEQDANAAGAELIALDFDGGNRRILKTYGNVQFGTTKSPQFAVGGNSVYTVVDTENGASMVRIPLNESTTTPKTIGVVTGDWGTFDTMCAGSDDTVIFKTLKSRAPDVEVRWVQRRNGLFEQLSQQTLPLASGDGLPFSSCVLTDKFLWVQNHAGGLRRIQLR